MAVIDDDFWLAILQLLAFKFMLGMELFRFKNEPFWSGYDMRKTKLKSSKLSTLEE